MMEGLKFMLPLSAAESESHGHHAESVLIPSLRPYGKFRWNLLLKEKEREDTLTFGRRIKLQTATYIHASWLCVFQVC